MTSTNYHIAGNSVSYLFDRSLSNLPEILSGKKYVVITDENIYRLHPKKFAKHKQLIIIPAGEAHKQQHTIDAIISKLIEYECDRNTYLVGVGGGVITDMVGFVASIFKRGIHLVLVPTTLLNLVDASLGGKNGIDVGIYKNMVGTIYQPKMIIQDLDFLDKLPEGEWINGMAEIIKHACIRDRKLFKELCNNSISDFHSDRETLKKLIDRNIHIKMQIVRKDVREQGDRKLLNFGHTLGHAIENTQSLPHGHAVSIGMVAAAHMSADILGFDQVDQLVPLLDRYNLPVRCDFEIDQVINVMKADKKRSAQSIDYVLLENIGKARVVPLSFAQIKKGLKQVIKKWKQ